MFSVRNSVSDEYSEQTSRKAATLRPRLAIPAGHAALATRDDNGSKGGSMNTLERGWRLFRRPGLHRPLGRLAALPVAFAVLFALTAGAGTAQAAAIAESSASRATASASAGSTEAGAEATSTLPVGSYSGNTGQDYGIDLYVSSNKTALQNITVDPLYLTCTPGGASPGLDVSINSVPLASNGSFSSTTTQEGDYAGNRATFKITLQGESEGLNSQGVPRVAGSVTETMKYSDGTAYSCTSKKVSWSATRDASQTVTTGLPPVGSYSGNTGQDYGIDLYVSSNKTALQNITVDPLYLTCTPGGASPGLDVSINSVPLASNGIVLLHNDSKR